MKSIKNNFFLNSILTATQVLYPLITLPYVSRVLQPEGIGLVNFADSINKYITLIAALGIPIYGVREIAKVRENKKKLNQLFSELFFIHLATTLLLILLYLLFVFTSPKLYSYKDLLIIGLPGIIGNVFIVEWYFQAIEKFRFITVRNILIRILGIVLIFTFVKSKDDSLTYALIMSLTLLINAIVNFYFLSKNVELNLKINLVNAFSRHFKPLFYLFVSFSFISIYTLLDTIILGFLTSDRSVGIYSTAIKLTKIPVLFLGALSTVLIPRLSSLSGAGFKDEYIKLIEKSIRFIYMYSIPTIILLISISDNIIHVFLGEEYLQVVPILQVSSILTLMLGLSNVFGFQILTTLTKDRSFTISVFIGTIASLIINFFAIPVFDIYGALAANLFSELIVVLLTYRFAKNFLEFDIQLKYLFRLIIASIPILGLILFFKYLFNNDFLIVMFSVFSSLIYFYSIHFYWFKDELIINLTNYLKTVIWRNTTI